MCCNACPCKRGGKLPTCCEHCSLESKRRPEGRDRVEVKDTACNTDWEEERELGNSAAIVRRRKRPRNSSSPPEGDRESAEDVCHHFGPWRGEVPPRPIPPEDAAARERIRRPEGRRAGRALGGQANVVPTHEPVRVLQRDQYHNSQTTSVEGVPRGGGSVSSVGNVESQPGDEYGASYMNTLDPEAQEVERADRHRHPEGRVVRSDLLRSGPVGGHRNPRRESSEDPDETARHLSFEDPSFDITAAEEPDFPDPGICDDAVSDIPGPSETVSFGDRHGREERHKMVDTSLQVGPELYRPTVAAPHRKKAQHRKNRDPESSDGTLEEEFEQHEYGRGAPRSTRRPPLNILKGERVVYKRTDSGKDLMIGVLSRRRHDNKNGGSSEDMKTLGNVASPRGRNRASQESYDPNKSVVPPESTVIDKISSLVSERSPTKVERGKKRGKKKATARARQAQPKAKSRAARKKTGVINAKRGAQRVAAAKASSKGATEARGAGKKTRAGRPETVVAAHAHREGGPTCAQYSPEDKCWKSDGTDKEILAGHKLVSYAKDRTMKIFSGVKCVVPLDSQHFMPVIFQLKPFQQKMPETVSEGNSAIILVLECGEGGDKAVEEFPILLHYEDKERALGTGDFFIVRAGITYSIQNEHRSKEAKILMVLRQDTVEDSGLNSDLEIS
ncbi:hypothetical protein Pmar_PMAR000917 [Perkinsus marinus ATCC 50983]|uniref:Uncharacterized protein n=1 Tax=Perkinsus marinus (strain ATCC 50983 / TXsc) TaxID=423536 RepID=C5LK35_PERM5|nr:hypothetical protein Pmar_PMAR000917 [Perkinsus marinus ATCC 50983]EER02924.1 hypothetical protein Pmar_PMAR000917 [Perkinsus marinus ATCC 50983]|eukprot:XP_002771108.1 hypothetical protein Pmar_PMAR000917 [Perkinsus marinus ATCC 50983]